MVPETFGERSSREDPGVSKQTTTKRVRRKTKKIPSAIQSELNAGFPTTGHDGHERMAEILGEPSSIDDTDVPTLATTAKIPIMVLAEIDTGLHETGNNGNERMPEMLGQPSSRDDSSQLQQPTTKRVRSKKKKNPPADQSEIDTGLLKTGIEGVPEMFGEPSSREDSSISQKPTTKRERQKTKKIPTGLQAETVTGSDSIGNIPPPTGEPLPIADTDDDTLTSTGTEPAQQANKPKNPLDRNRRYQEKKRKEIEAARELIKKSPDDEDDPNGEKAMKRQRALELIARNYTYSFTHLQYNDFVIKYQIWCKVDIFCVYS
ncbi:hypothetical protein RF11_14624 [Thelohanellus kitauei]|uniref:Uncharacterized protein n=1 Tax=Thelohanellus kitauei TaxID=669202 RepID=A0A0C2J7I3_THEKT|nr:hypothetical protein RF11_14624 [Thelohanellus kitauei]